MAIRLDGKVALITGAAGGSGSADPLHGAAVGRKRHPGECRGPRSRAYPIAFAVRHG